MNDSLTSNPLAYSAETIAAGLRALCKCTPPYRCCLLCQGAEHLERRLTEVYFACGHTVAHEEACPRCQIERLRAALEKISQDEFGTDDDNWEESYWNVVNTAREALGAAHETPAVTCSCERSDAWRCAVDKKLSTVSCHCACHRAASKTPAVTVDVPKLQTDLELAHAAINRVYTGRVRDMLRLLADNEISSARAHEWLAAFVRDGVDRPMPGDADKTNV